MNKLAVAIVAFVFVAAAVAVYVLTQNGGSSSGQRVEALTLALDQDPATLDPIVAADVVSYSVINAIHAPLALVNDQNELVMVVAEQIEMSEDALRCDIKIRQGLTFWDGSPVTAEDLRYSIDRLAASAHPHKWVLERIEDTDPETPGLSGIEVVDPHSLSIAFSTPDAEFDRFISNAVLSVVKKDSAESEAAPFDTHVIGCGPYAPDKIEPGKQFVLKKNEGFGLAEGVETLTFRVISSSPQQLQAFAAGDLDVLRLRGSMIGEAAELDDTGALTPKPRFAETSVFSAQANELTFLIFEWEAEALSSIPAEGRKAFLAGLSAAYPRAAIAQRLYLGQAQPAFGVVPPSAADQAYAWPTPTDWPRPGQVPLLGSNDTDSRRIANSIQAEFAKSGVELNLEFVELSQLVDRILSGTSPSSLFWIEQLIPAKGPMAWALFWRTDSFFSTIGQPLEGVAEQIETARGTLDPERRQALYAEVLADINQRQHTFLPLLSRNTVLMYRDHVDGLFVDVNGVPYWTFIGAGEGE